MAMRVILNIDLLSDIVRGLLPVTIALQLIITIQTHHHHSFFYLTNFYFFHQHHV